MQMNLPCEVVVFSDRAYNAIVRESFAMHPLETGGILLGHILDNGVWIVMEVIPPGLECVHEKALFEYDPHFVSYLSTSVANLYHHRLQVLGLWHRHPGSMDYFSPTDDVTNSDFASRNPYGVISGLVNIDPAFRLTLYHLPAGTDDSAAHGKYSMTAVEVGDDIIPEKYFKLRYIDRNHRNLTPRISGISDLNADDSVSVDQPADAHGTDGILEVPPKGCDKTVAERSPRKKSRALMLAVSTGCLLLGLGGGYCIASMKVHPAPEQEITPLKKRVGKNDHSDSSRSTRPITVMKNEKPARHQ